MYRFLQESFNRSGPLLFFVKFVEILTFTEQMRQANLMVEEVKREVCAVAVCDCGHPLQRVSEPVFQFLSHAAFGVEYQSEIHRLRYPGPVKSFIAVAARLIEPDDFKLWLSRHPGMTIDKARTRYREEQKAKRRRQGPKLH